MENATSHPALTGSNRDRFAAVLESQLAYHFEHDPKYAPAKARFTPSELAARLVEGLVSGSADKDGAATKATCKALGVKHTYGAIKTYLTAPADTARGAA